MDYICSKCSKVLKSSGARSTHEKYCQGFGSRLDQHKKKSPTKECPKCSRKISNRQFNRHFNKCTGKIKERFGQGQNWNKGKTFVEIYGKDRAKKIKQKLSNKAKGRKPLYKIDEQERRDRISKGMKWSYSQGRSKGWKHQDTYPEIFFKNFFIMLGYVEGIDFIREARFLRYRVDFFFRKCNIGIEIDGEQHYRFKEIQEKDRIRDQKLKEIGIEIIRVSWSEVSKNRRKMLTYIKKLIESKLWGHGPVG